MWRGDADRLRQIFANLVSNAVKFTAEGAVTARFEAADAGGLRLSVTDTGIGIAAATRSSPCSRSSPRPTPRPRASTAAPGLGLAICRELAQLMGGQISVMSEEGEGSTFIVELPFRARRPCRERDAPPSRSRTCSIAASACSPPRTTWSTRRC